MSNIAITANGEFMFVAKNVDNAAEALVQCDRAVGIDPHDKGLPQVAEEDRMDFYVIEDDVIDELDGSNFLPSYHDKIALSLTDLGLLGE